MSRWAGGKRVVWRWASAWSTRMATAGHADRAGRHRDHLVGHLLVPDIHHANWTHGPGFGAGERSTHKPARDLYRPLRDRTRSRDRQGRWQIRAATPRGRPRHAPSA